MLRPCLVRRVGSPGKAVRSIDAHSHRGACRGVSEAGQFGREPRRSGRRRGMSSTGVLRLKSSRMPGSDMKMCVISGSRSGNLGLWRVAVERCCRPATHETLSEEGSGRLEHRRGDVSICKEIIQLLERGRIEPLFLKESGPEFPQRHSVALEQIRCQTSESLHLLSLSRPSPSLHPRRIKRSDRARGRNRKHSFGDLRGRLACRSGRTFAPFSIRETG
jgi:hypothetical protein